MKLTVRILFLLAFFLSSTLSFSVPAPAFACSDQSPAQDGCQPPAPARDREDNAKDIEENKPPVCVIGQPVIDGLTVTFFSESYDPEGSQLSYYWFFGESDNSDQIDGVGNPGSFAYSQEGTYTVRLKIFDDSVNSAMCSTTVSILVRVAHEPVCSFKYEELEDGVFTFNSTSTDPDGQVEGFTWQLDDGDISYGSSTSLKLEPGNHTMTLAVTDNEYFGTTCSREVIYTPVPDEPNQAATCSQQNDGDGTSNNNINICGDNNAITVTTDPAVAAQLEYLTGQVAQMRMEQDLQTGMIASLQQQVTDLDNRVVNFEEAQLPITMATYELLQTIHHKVSRILLILTYIWDYLIPGNG